MNKGFEFGVSFLFASATSYTSRGHGNQNRGIYLSVGVTCILFCFTLTTVYYSSLLCSITLYYIQYHIYHALPCTTMHNSVLPFTMPYTPVYYPALLLCVQYV